MRDKQILEVQQWMTAQVGEDIKTLNALDGGHSYLKHVINQLAESALKHFAGQLTETTNSDFVSIANTVILQARVRATNE